MNHEEAMQVGPKLGQFIADNGLTQLDVARKIGVSTTVISQFVRGKYSVDDLTDLAAKVVAYMNKFARRSSRETSGFIETTVAKAIFTVIEATDGASDDHEGRIALVIGDAGHGKSVCLRQYAKSNPNSIYVVLNGTMNIQAVFFEIAKALVDNGVKLNLACSLRNLVGQMADSIGRRSMIVILDEASALKVRHLNELRQVITVSCRCPLILSGNSHLLHTVNKPPTDRGYDASLDQFCSRLVCVLDLDAEATAGGKDGGGVYSPEDIRQLYQYGGLRLSGGAVTMLLKIARTPGSGRLRTCSNIISMLLASPVVAAGKVDEILILQAIKALRLPVLNRLPVRIEAARDEDDTPAEAKTG